MADGAILLTDDYRKNGAARAVPGSYYGAGGWYLPPEPDPDSARIALRIFPKLQLTNPELVATARLSSVDYRPVDLATAAWGEGRPVSEDPWQRVLAAMKDL